MARRAPRTKTIENPAEETLHEPPVALSAVLGQERALRVLSSSLASGRLHHAWIFHGPSGVGKMTTALAFAGMLLDATTAPGLTGEIAPDPESDVQRRLAAGAHPDLHVIVKELAKFSDDKKIRDRKLTSIPLEVVRRRLLEPAALASNLPGGAASKVFIIDEAHLLNTATQNAVLKTLEEPADGTVLILVTDAEDRLLPTIRSRCQRVGFAPLSDDSMAGWLRGAPEAEGLEPNRAGWLKRYAEGSPGRFVRAMEAGIDRWEQELAGNIIAASRGELEPGFGGAMQKLVDQRATELVAKDKNASKDAANRAAAAEMFALIAAHARAELSNSAFALGAIDALRRAERELGANVQMQLVFDHLASGLAASGRGADMFVV
ncbi:MAG: AAA family ATPase [Planctomycetota bacterium]